jgi:hypothetical protein
MGQPPQVVIGQPAFDPEDVSEEIDNLRLPHAGASLSATLAEIETIVRRAEQNQPRLVRKRVVFFTDLQQQTWNDATTADGRQRLARLEQVASLSLVDLGEAAASNLAVARLEASQPLVTTRQDVTLSAEVQSFARQDAARQSVEFLVDSQRIADERVDVPAGGRTTVSTNHRFATPGDHIVEVRLADDSLPLDNRRWLSLSVREAIRVLAVAGRPGEARHVALALNPRSGERGAIEVTEVAESALVETDLAPYDCIVLCNVGRFSREEASVLRRHLNRGGGVITFLGDQVQRESYNQQFAGDDPKFRVLPARLGELSPDGEHRVDPLEYRHPLLAPFRGHERSGLLTTPIWRYVQLAPFPDARIALGFDGGDAAIVEEQMGRGRSVLFASAASAESLDQSTTPPTPWTAISSWPSFPPLVHEMLAYAIGGRSEGRSVLVGDDLTGIVAGGAAAMPATLTRPDGASQKLALVPEGVDARWTVPNTDTSGVFTVQLPGSDASPLAVNLNTRESDLARFDSELLPSQFNRETHTIGDPPPTLAASEGRSFFRLLLSAMLVLVLVEPCLAWHFGRGRG